MDVILAQLSSFAELGRGCARGGWRSLRLRVVVLPEWVVIGPGRVAIASAGGGDRVRTGWRSPRAASAAARFGWVGSGGACGGGAGASQPTAAARSIGPSSRRRAMPSR